MTMSKDPVCGKRIKTQRAHVTVEHEGFTYPALLFVGRGKALVAHPGFSQAR